MDQSNHDCRRYEDIPRVWLNECKTSLHHVVELKCWLKTRGATTAKKKKHLCSYCSTSELQPMHELITWSSLGLRSFSHTLGTSSYLIQTSDLSPDNRVPSSNLVATLNTWLPVSIFRWPSLKRTRKNTQIVTNFVSFPVLPRICLLYDQ